MYIRVTARLLVALYLLASCRALVPGLCATQASIETAQEAQSQASVQTAHSCCTMNLATRGKSNVPAPVRVKTSCAFCELAKGQVTLAPILTLDVSLHAVESYVSPTSVQFVPQRLWKRGSARAPPCSEFA